MESARAVGSASPDIGRAGAVDKAPPVVTEKRLAANDSRVTEKNSPTPTLEFLRETFRDSVQSANERLSDRGTSISLSVDPSTSTVIVQVKDNETGDMVRQIPPESAMQVSRNIERLTGILVDKKI